jgi:DNA-binding NarL/FixJ family response regulator
MNSPSQIIVADDHPLFRAALCQAMENTLEAVDILQCDSINSLEQTVSSHRNCDLILLDLQMPGANGFSGLVLIRREYPEIPVVIVSAREDSQTISRSLSFGASGFIPKSSDLPTIGAAIQAVLNGEVWFPEHLSDQQQVPRQEELEFSERIKTLTPQQLKVYMMLTKGLLNKQIAAEINVSEATIRTHMTAIFRKLGVRNRTQAVLAAGFLNLDDKGLD